MAEDRLAGFVIATVHSEESRELDWLMVDPHFHGRGIADRLMRPAMEWLGIHRPMWLNVVRHNERAIRFYRKHGFEIDLEAVCPARDAALDHAARLKLDQRVFVFGSRAGACPASGVRSRSHRGVRAAAPTGRRSAC